MDEIIRKIIQIEERAQHIMDDANHQKEEIRKQADLEIAEMKKEIKTKAEMKIDQIRNKELKEARENAEQIQKDTEERVNAMKEYGFTNKEKWAEKLFNQVIER